MEPGKPVESAYLTIKSAACGPLRLGSRERRAAIAPVTKAVEAEVPLIFTSPPPQPVSIHTVTGSGHIHRRATVGKVKMVSTRIHCSHCYHPVVSRGITHPVNSIVTRGSDQHHVSGQGVGHGASNHRAVPIRAQTHIDHFEPLIRCLDNRLRQTKRVAFAILVQHSERDQLRAGRRTSRQPFLPKN